MYNMNCFLSWCSWFDLIKIFGYFIRNRIYYNHFSVKDLYWNLWKIDQVVLQIFLLYFLSKFPCLNALGIESTRRYHEGSDMERVPRFYFDGKSQEVAQIWRILQKCKSKMMEINSIVCYLIIVWLYCLL